MCRGDLSKVVPFPLPRAVSLNLCSELNVKSIQYETVNMDFQVCQAIFRIVIFTRGIWGNSHQFFQSSSMCGQLVMDNISMKIVIFKMSLDLISLNLII